MSLENLHVSIEFIRRSKDGKIHELLSLTPDFSNNYFVMYFFQNYMIYLLNFFYILIHVRKIRRGVLIE